MSAEHDAFYNLAERLENTYLEIDSDICAYLRENDSGYAELWREAINLQRDFPIIPQITEGSGTITMSAEEHTALVRYLGLKHDMENVERKHIYFRGHTDSYAYLKKIGAV